MSQQQSSYRVPAYPPLRSHPPPSVATLGPKKLEQGPRHPGTRHLRRAVDGYPGTRLLRRAVNGYPGARLLRRAVNGYPGARLLRAGGRRVPGYSRPKNTLKILASTHGYLFSLSHSAFRENSSGTGWTRVTREGVDLLHLRQHPAWQSPAWELGATGYLKLLSSTLRCVGVFDRRRKTAGADIDEKLTYRPCPHRTRHRAVSPFAQSLVFAPFVSDSRVSTPTPPPASLVGENPTCSVPAS